MSAYTKEYCDGGWCRRDRSRRRFWWSEWEERYDEGGVGEVEVGFSGDVVAADLSVAVRGVVYLVHVL